MMQTAGLDKKTIFEQLQRNSRKLQQYGMRQIGLFGSFVGNEATTESVDLLVDFEKEKKTFKNFIEFPRRVSCKGHGGLPYTI